jgi:hypothetical protein
LSVSLTRVSRRRTRRSCSTSAGRASSSTTPASWPPASAPSPPTPLVKNQLCAGYDSGRSAGYRDVALNLRLDTPGTRRLGFACHVCELVGIRTTAHHVCEVHGCLHTNSSLRAIMHTLSMAKVAACRMAYVDQRCGSWGPGAQARPHPHKLDASAPNPRPPRPGPTGRAACEKAVVSHPPLPPPSLSYRAGNLCEGSRLAAPGSANASWRRTRWTVSLRSCAGA